MKKYINCDECGTKCDSMGVGLRCLTYHKWDDRVLCYDCMIRLYGRKIKIMNGFKYPPEHPMCK